jgi:hypothetical protein
MVVVSSLLPVLGVVMNAYLAHKFSPQVYKYLASFWKSAPTGTANVQALSPVYENADLEFYTKCLEYTAIVGLLFILLWIALEIVEFFWRGSTIINLGDSNFDCPFEHQPEQQKVERLHFRLRLYRGDPARTIRAQGSNGEEVNVIVIRSWDDYE